VADPPDDVPYQSLYRRFRPSTFAEVRGQDHVVLALRNAVRDQRVAHAYLFSGPRGTGKTSTARILAKALNCTNLQDGEPCGQCSSCLEITKGTSLDVHELDAASNNGVEAMRDLVSRAALGTPGRQKVYIVDEVHMLSTAASNALLKTLEEPPAHVIFVLATTDPQKVLPTIRSRTQHFEFRLLGPETLGELLDQVRRDAHLDVPDEALDLAVRRGRGSARDALSVLDQVAASDSVDDDLPELDEIVEALAERDVGRGLVAVAHLTAAGFSPQQLTGDLVEYLRQGFLALMARDLVTFSGTERDQLATRAERVGLAALVRGMEVLGEAQVAMRDAPDPRVNLEVALIRLTHPEADDSPGALLARVERLEAAGRAQSSAPDGTRSAHGVAAGAGASAPVAAASPAPVAAAAAAVAAPSAPASPSASVSPSAPASPDAPSAPSAPAATAPAAPSGKGKKTIGATIRGSAPAGEGVESAGGVDPGPPTATASATTPAASAAPPEPAAPAAAPANSALFPTRDQLVQAWGDHIIGRLRPKAKALFQAGRFVGVDGDRAVFGLPNDMHRTRCEDVRGDVEAALSEHFGLPVGLTLVVDPGGAEGQTATDATSPGPAPVAPPAPRPSSRGAPEGTGQSPTDPPSPPVASDPTDPDPGRPPGDGRHSAEDRHSGDQRHHQETAEEEDLSAFDESELGEIADIDNSAEARVLQAFPGAEEVL
jgi:DNA polymerase-3 subunit gamma/tau